VPKLLKSPVWITKEGASLSKEDLSLEKIAVFRWVSEINAMVVTCSLSAELKGASGFEVNSEFVIGF
jgi:hypothetical protein